MKKVIVVDSTYHVNGTSSAAADFLAKNITNAEVEVFSLKDRRVNPCLGCNYCKAKDTPQCVQQDDMALLIGRIDQCDALVLCSPIYFGGICGQAKIFLDRLYAFFNPGKPGMSIATKRGKKGLVVCTRSAPAAASGSYAEDMAKNFGFAGVDEARGLVCGEVRSGLSDEHIASLTELARWLSE